MLYIDVLQKVLMFDVSNNLDVVYFCLLRSAIDICVRFNHHHAFTYVSSMAICTLLLQARERWSLLNIIMQHKLGSCPISDVSIAIIVSSVHRQDSLEAVRFAIDELKNSVPIWKKVTHVLQLTTHYKQYFVHVVSKDLVLQILSMCIYGQFPCCPGALWRRRSCLER